MSPKHAKRVTIDGAQTSLNFKEFEELGEDLQSMIPSPSNASKQKTYKKLPGITIPEQEGEEEEDDDGNLVIKNPATDRAVSPEELI